jgi:hypothetical protein
VRFARASAVLQRVAMGNHETYGKLVLRSAAGPAYRDQGPDVQIDYGTHAPAKIDGTVGPIAVEIESRTSKQVRGAVLDLICHQGSKELLVLLPAHTHSVTDTAVQCRNILGRFIDPADFRVVMLTGTGDRPALEDDVNKVRTALSELGWTAFHAR